MSGGTVTVVSPLVIVTTKVAVLVDLGLTGEETGASETADAGAGVSMIGSTFTVLLT